MICVWCLRLHATRGRQYWISVRRGLASVTCFLMYVLIMRIEGYPLLRTPLCQSLSGVSGLSASLHANLKDIDGSSAQALAEHKEPTVWTIRGRIPMLLRAKV